MRRGASLVVLALIAAATAAPASADRLVDRQREATRVERQLARMDGQLERAAEALDGARQRLTDTDAAITTNELALVQTQARLEHAREVLASQLVLRFRTGEGDPTLVLLGATSVTDLVGRIDVLRRTSAQTTQVIDDVLLAKAAIDRVSAALARQRAARSVAVARLTAARAQLAAGITARTRYLATVRAAIRTIIAERAAAAAAAARRAAEQLRLERQHAAAVQAAAAAEQRRKHRPPPPPPPPDPGIGGSSGGSSGGGTIVPPSHTGSAAADAALTQLGVPYVWAGASPQEGFDCSGLTMWAYAQVGVSLPHNAADQHAMGTPIARDALQPGDLVFFDGDAHVAIYVGNGQVVHAPHTGAVVRIASLDGFPGYNGAVRIL